MHKYDRAFFEYVNSGAVISAERLLPVLIREMKIRTVLDVGCGTGAWLSVWHKLGTEVLGLDGDYVDHSQLLIPAESFIPYDLTQGFSLGRRFDLVQSLEVAEHLPEARAEGFIADLAKHGDLVLFSAAPKGQGGDYHINEQSYEYWRQRFARHGYVPLDYVRPRVIADRNIEPWYRYNTMLFAAPARFDRLPEIMRGTLLGPSERIRDLSPRFYRLRKACVRVLPRPIVTHLSKRKERVMAMIRGARQRSA